MQLILEVQMSVTFAASALLVRFHNFYFLGVVRSYGYRFRLASVIFLSRNRAHACEDAAVLSLACHAVSFLPLCCKNEFFDKREATKMVHKQGEEFRKICMLSKLYEVRSD